MSFGSKADKHPIDGYSHEDIELLFDDSEEEEPVQIDSKPEEESKETRVSRPSSISASRPQSKPNLLERLENEADLNEFEQKEREILQQIEDERQQKPNDEDLEIIGFNEQPLEAIVEEQEESKSDSVKQRDPPIQFPDSVQNRQLDLSIKQQDSVESTYSNSSDYPGGFSVQAITAPPPAYNTIPADEPSQEPKQIQLVEELTKNDGNLSGSSSRKTSEGVGSVVAQAGGIASALAKTVTSANQELKMSEASRSSEDFEEFDMSNQTIQKQQVHSNISSPNYRLSNDIKELSHYVEEFTAERIDIQPVLRPFFLDYIPAVGDVDPFLKIPRPDQIDDQLGLLVLDEPSAKQSDTTIVEMKLRQLSNVVSKPEDAPVKKLDRADKKQNQIENWIKNIKELRRSRPPDRVAYSRQMPDLEKLMQEWSPEMDAFFQNFTMPSAKLDCSVEEYSDICLSMMDIPVHKARIPALHLLFSLYAEFKNSQHFRNLASNNGNSSFLYGDAPKTADRLTL